ncbi:caspase family protein [Nocardiopsis sp. NPDC050513]|uniref:caspase family protein n=1 Tax=Nocardiopsis sp. NPDC050513 TaxID=3364338 RepID=UPI00378D5763
MPTETGRRFLVAVGVSRYQHLPSDGQLGGVGEDVRAVRDLFTGLGYTSVLEGVGEYDSAHGIRERIRFWAEDVELDETDIVVVYFAGHGYAPDRDRHYLCCWDTKIENPASTALATEDLARILCEGRLRRLMVVLDTCSAGAGASDAAGYALRTLAYRFTGGDVASSVCFLSSARAKDLAQDRAFAPALREAVAAATERAGQRQPYLDLASVVQHVNDHFGESGVHQRAELAKGAGTGLDPFLPNDSYRPGLPAEGTDLDLQRQAAELIEHYGPRSRGVEFESEQGRYFSGRERVLRELVDLVTLGSPLGISGLIFDRLVPSPSDGRGTRPPSVGAWTDVADRRDVVALVKALDPLFGGVDDRSVDNGPKAHDAAPYLTSRQVGEAVAAGLSA